MFRLHFRSTFTKTFSIILSSFLLIILLYNIIFTHITKDIYMETRSSTYQLIVENTAAHLDTVLSTITDDALILAQDSNILNSLLIPVADYNDRNYKILQTLNRITEENRYIKSAQYYIKDFGVAFNSAKEIGAISSLKNSDAITYSITNNTSDGFHQRIGYERRYLEYNLDFPIHKQYTLGKIILNLNADSIYQTVVGKLPSPDHYMLMIDDDDNVIFSSETQSALISQIDQINRSLKSPDSDQNITLNHMKYKIFLSESTLTGWRCIYMVPYSQIIPVQNLLLTTLFPLSILTILASILLAALASKHLNAPLGRLMHTVMAQLSPDPGQCSSTANELDFISNHYSLILAQNEKLEQIVHHSIPIILESFYNSILQGKEMTDADLLLYQPYFKIADLAQKQYIFIILQIPCSSPDLSDELYLNCQSATVKMSSSILSSTTEYERYIYCTMDRLRTVVLIALPSDINQVELKKDLMKKADYIRSEIQKETGLTVTAGISRIHTGLNNIHSLYLEALNALQYRVYLGADNSIDFEQITTTAEKLKNTEKFYYDCINKLINALCYSDSEAISRHLDTYFGYLKRNGPTDINYIRRYVMLLLDSLIQHAISANIAVSPITGKDGELYSACYTINTIDDFRKYCGHICIQLHDQMADISSQKYSRYVQTAREYIAEHYQDSNITLNTAADYAGISSAYLSRLIKKEFQENYIDYLNKFRIQKAKELLGNTFVTVKEAGYMTGFSNVQSFIRTFKKYEGITPGQFQNQSNIHSS